MQSENKFLIDCGSASGRAPLWAVLTWPFRALGRALSRAAVEEPMTAVELAALQRAVEELPPRTRLALRLAGGGASYEQIGAELGTDARTAKKLVERAMEYLLERMASP